MRRPIHPVGVSSLLFTSCVVLWLGFTCSAGTDGLDPMAEGGARRVLLPLPASDVALNSTRGVQLLREATHARPFHQLSLHFETQRNQAFCSAATAVTILNALTAEGLAAPVDALYAPYPYFTQRAVFENACVNSVRTHDGGRMSVKFLATHGATLDEWRDYLACFVGDDGVTHAHASEGDAESFRAALKTAFAPASPVAYVGINFHRTEMGEAGGGHMSPVGAYDATTDRVLVMDVSRYKYPPVWTPLVAAYDAMNTTDGASGESRGWVVVRHVHGGGEPSGAGETSGAGGSTVGRDACMTVAGDTDWDAVMGCMRRPRDGSSSGGGGKRGGGVSVGSAVLSAMAAACVGAGAVGAAWRYVDRQREAKFRKHVVMEGDFEDI